MYGPGIGPNYLPKPKLRSGFGSGFFIETKLRYQTPTTHLPTWSTRKCSAVVGSSSWYGEEDKKKKRNKQRISFKTNFYFGIQTIK